VLANIRLSEGDPRGAIEHYERALALGDRSVLPGLVRAYAAAGRQQDARKLLGDIIKNSRERYASSTDLARAYFAMGERDSAFVYIEKALEERNPALLVIGFDPADSALAADPRFASIEQRIGLESE